MKTRCLHCGGEFREGTIRELLLHGPACPAHPITLADLQSDVNNFTADALIDVTELEKGSPHGS